MMKGKIITILYLFMLTISYSYSQIDTLESVYEFSSPSSNPWGITWDGSNLWISDNNSGTIYKSNVNGETIDSIKINILR